jgi:N-methylhydantoinase A
MTLEKLVQDGRIHPARIEEMHERSTREIEEQIKRAGEEAMMDVGITDIHPEMIKLLGRLQYRTSYGQNVLKHLVESAHIAAAIAAELGIERILCPRASGVLSALGLLASERRRDTARTVMLRGDELTAEGIAAEVRALREGLAEGLGDATAEVTYELRYRGQSFELPVAGDERPTPERLAEEFAAEHERRYGYRDPGAAVELVNVRLALVEPGPDPRPRAADEGALDRGSRRARFNGEWLEAEVLRGEPPAGTVAEGPCVFELPEATLVLPPGWRGEVDDAGTVRAERGR